MLRHLILIFVRKKLVQLESHLGRILCIIHGLALLRRVTIMNRLVQILIPLLGQHVEAVGHKHLLLLPKLVLLF